MVKKRGKATVTKTLSWEERMMMFHEVTESLDHFAHGDKLCITNKKLGDAISMSKRFGSPSAFGEAWLGFTFENGYKVAVKKMPLGKHDVGKAYTVDQMLSGESAWIEIAAYMFCTFLVLTKTCPNLPFMYKYFWCPKCAFTNKQIRGPKVKPCLLVVNELADADLTHYLDKEISIWSHDLIENCVFQIAAGLYALEKFYRMTHNDLHDGNILVHVVQPGGFWHYQIDGKNYYVPNLGYVFLLWDLGMCHIPGKMKGQPDFYTMDASPVPSETDIGRICGIMGDVFRERKYEKYLGKKPNKLLGDIMREERRQQSVKSVLVKHFKMYTKKNPGKDEILDTFNMDINKQTLKELHPPELKKYVR